MKIYARFILLIAMVTLLLFTAQVVNAEGTSVVSSGSCGDSLTWALDSEGTLIISGSGVAEDYASASASPWYSQRASIKAIVVADGVTSIGDRAFYNCTALTDVSIGKDVQTIGTYAFRGCTALSEVVIPANVTELKASAFRTCTALSLVICESNAPIVGDYVFNDGADSLTVQYYEGSTGFDVSPWSEFAQKTMHVGQWVVDSEVSCTTDGVRHIDCSYCGTTITETILGGHDYVDGVCTVCQDHEVLDSGTCGTNLTWELDGSGKLSISGMGDMTNYSSSSATPWYSYREKIDCVVIANGVMSVGNSAFSDCKGMTDIVIPDSVTSIGNSAFYGCAGLTAVIIPDSVTTIGGYAFSTCSNLESINIPDGVSSIDLYTFFGCSSLMNITIPHKVTRIGEYAFKGCSSLTSIKLPDSLTSIGSAAFSGCSGLQSISIPFVGNSRKTATDTYQYPFGYIFGTSSYTGGVKTNQTYYGSTTARTTSGIYYIPKSLTIVTVTGGEILHGAFDECLSLTSITLLDGITSIGDSAFEKCTGLTRIDLPNSVTHIGNSSFANCTGLTRIDLPNSVTHIGNSSFANCSRLTQISLPDNLLSIGESAFYFCSNLRTVTIPESVVSIGSSAFSSCSSLNDITIPSNVSSVKDSTFKNCTSLTDITIPNNVTSIGSSAFSHCIELNDIYIPGSVTSVGGSAFQGCKKLQSITIPDGVTSVGNSAFSNCTSLTSVTIPESVTSIDYGVFYGCTSLKRIVIPESVTCIEFNMFSGCTSLTDVIIPESIESIDDYVFRNCTSLTSIAIPESVNSIGTGVFYGCTSLESVSFPDSVSSISNMVFYGCTSLAEVRFPDALTSIGGSTFTNCTNLQQVVLPNSLTSIGDSTFAGCSSLQSVLLPNGVSSIGNSAFGGCRQMRSVTIPDSLTSVDYRAFSGCTALSHVYYTGTQTQWGKITVATLNEPLLNAKLICLGDVKFAGASISLQHNLAVNYKVDKALFETVGFENPYVIVEFNETQTKLTEYTVSGDRYVFSFRNVAPNQVNDTLVATLYATYDGVEYPSKPREYSVAEYCYSMLDECTGDEYAELRTLLVDLLNYAAAAQTYTNYNVDNLANAALTETQQAWGTAADPQLNTVLDTAYKTVENPTVKWKGGGLLLQDAVVLRFKFTAESVDGLSVKVESGTNTWTVTADQFVEENGVFYVYFAGLDAGQMRQNVYLTIYDGETPVSNTVCYSIESYAYEKQNSTIAGLSDLVKAMMRYGDSAVTYKN